jgi:hypothetical protein
LPEPLVFPLSVIQLALSVAVQEQLALVVRENDPLPPAAATLAADGEMAYEHAAAAWVTVYVCPLTVMVPVREVVFEFAAALKLTVPLPVPLGDPVMVSQLLLLAAVHEQLEPAATPNDPVPPPAPTDPLDGDSA